MKPTTLKRFAWRTAIILPLLAPLAAQADYPSIVAGLKPVAYYRLNATNQIPSEFAATNSGSLGAAFNGEYQSMAASRGLPGALAGDPNTSVSVVGASGQQVVVPFSTAYNPNGPFSVEFWAKPANTDAGRHAVAISMVNGQNLANGDDRSGWCVLHNGADWQVILGYNHSDGATYYGTTLTAAGTVTEAVWQHVAVVYSGAAVSIFVNGAQVATQAPDFPMLPNTGAPLIIGDRGYTGWDYNGLVDELAIYTSALSAATIKSHYDNGLNAARAQAYPDLVKEQNPALYFRLGEPSLQLPVAVNSGSYGAAANGLYLVGTTPGVPGLQQPAATGFETTNVAAGFNGTSGSVQIPGLSLNTDTVTMVCWLKRNGAQPARAGIMHNRKVTATEVKATGLGFQDDGLALSYNWEDLAAAYNFNPGFIPPDQVWTFYAVTVSPTEAVMFMGTATGLVAATNTLEHLPHDFSGTTLELGWDNYQATRVMKGQLDEFAIFDKTLNESEIRSLYNAALPAILGLVRTPVDPVYEGLKVTFQVSVAGPAPTYQWQKDGVALSGKTQSSLVLDSVVPSDTGGYSVVVTSGGKTLTSAVSRLDVVTSPPVLSQTPASAVRFLNGAVQFQVVALGSQPLTYVWKHGADVIPGATKSTLVISDLQAADAGDYTVVVTNPLGTKEASATLTLVTPAKFAAAAVNAGPIGYWRLDETSGGVAYDYWGGRDGTYALGVTNNVVGPAPTAFKGFDTGNKAYDFSGGGSEVDIPALNINKATLTIVAWIKPNGAPDDYDGIVFSRGGGTVAGLDFQLGGQLGYHWNDTANTYGWASGLYPVLDQWNFVALVVEPELGTIYLDDGSGLVSSENAVTHSPEEFNGTLRLGADGNGARFYKGTLDEVVIYDRALTSAEIKTLRDAGIAGTYSPVPASFAQQPKSETIMVGSIYTLAAKVNGSVPLSFQWKKGATDLPGAIRSSLTIANATEADTGAYQLVVTQGATTVNSTPATLTVKPVPAYVDLPDNLVLHLKFEGDYKDSSGRNNHGAAVGSPTLVAGKIGNQALHYSSDGATPEGDNYVTLGQRNDLSFGAGQNFSLACWFKFTGSSVDLPFFSNDDWGGGGEGYYFGPYWDTTGTWFWSLHNVGNTASLESKGTGSPINDGLWHHLVASFDWKGNAATYLDGAPAASASLIGLSIDVAAGITRPTNIGATGDPNIFRAKMAADLDDLGVWRRALSPYEAQAIYVVGQQHGRSFDDAGPVITDPALKISASGTNVEITWTNGTLESADTVTGSAWTPVQGASAPKYTVTPSANAKFYRVKL